MSLFHGPEEHAENPPSSWKVTKYAERCWHLETRDGVCIESCKTKREAEQLRKTGFAARLYEEERRWYAGEPIANRRPWADIVAERARRQARIAS